MILRYIDSPGCVALSDMKGRYEKRRFRISEVKSVRRIKGYSREDRIRNDSIREELVVALLKIVRK